MLPKGCLRAQSWVWMEHFQNWQVDENQNFCFLTPPPEALQTDFSLGRAVSRSRLTNSLCHLYIYIIITTNFAVVGISRSSVSAPRREKK